MNTKIKKWFTPIHVVALILVLVGAALQLYTIFVAKSDALQGAAIGFFILGIVVELIGQAIGDSRR